MKISTLTLIISIIILGFAIKNIVHYSLYIKQEQELKKQKLKLEIEILQKQNEKLK